MDAIKAARHSVVLLSGEEENLRRAGLSDLLGAVGVDKNDFDVESISADDDSPGNWLARVGTSPFMADRRVLIVRNLLRAGDPKELLKKIDLSCLPDHSLLVLVVDDEREDDDRKRRHTVWRGQWERAVKESGGFVEKFEFSPKNLSSWLKKRAESQGVTLTDRAADTLGEMTAMSLSRAAEELDKLVLFVGQGGAIREADVEAVALPSREWNVFKLVDAAIQGDNGQALKQLRILVGSASRAEEAAFRSILPQLSRQLRLLFQARVLLDMRQSQDQIDERTQRLLPSKSIASESPWIQNKAMAAARKITFAQIVDGLEAVALADAKLKGALPAYSAVETLELLVLHLAQTLAKPLRSSA